MDFFAYQDAARRNTRLLIFYYAVAVVLIILAIYVVVTLIFAEAASYGHASAKTAITWDPMLFLWVLIATLAIVSSGTVYKIMALSSGGEAVARMLGARAVSPNTQDLAERRLLNVVEEIALASGVRVPPVFVLDDEQSINAFAAGFSPADAVVTVTAGTLRQLTRERVAGRNRA